MKFLFSRRHTMSDWGWSGIEKVTFDFVYEKLKHGSDFIELEMSIKEHTNGNYYIVVSNRNEL